MSDGKRKTPPAGVPPVRAQESWDETTDVREQRVRDALAEQVARLVQRDVHMHGFDGGEGAWGRHQADDNLMRDQLKVLVLWRASALGVIAGASAVCAAAATAIVLVVEHFMR